MHALAVKNENSTNFKRYLNEIQEKLNTIKEFGNLDLEEKSKIPYGPLAVRVSKLISYCEQLKEYQKDMELAKKKSEFLMILQKETIQFSTCLNDKNNFQSCLLVYKNLSLESEVQMILRDSVAFPVIKEFMPKQNVLLDDSFEVQEFFNKVSEEIDQGKLQLFVRYGNCCNILIKSLWKAIIKALLLKSKIFSPVFSQDYSTSLLSSVKFFESIGSKLNFSIRSTQDFTEFLE
jgi:hypothetical protein